VKALTREQKDFFDQQGYVFPLRAFAHRSL
jgi:hypothetical protein